MSGNGPILATIQAVQPASTVAAAGTTTMRRTSALRIAAGSIPRTATSTSAFAAPGPINLGIGPLIAKEINRDAPSAKRPAVRGRAYALTIACIRIVSVASDVRPLPLSLSSRLTPCLQRPSERGGRLAPRREAQARCRRCGERNSPAKSKRANPCMVQASKPNERDSRAIEARIKESNPHRVTKVKRRRHRMEAERSKRDGRPPRAVRAPRLHSQSLSPSLFASRQWPGEAGRGHPSRPGRRHETL